MKKRLIIGITGASGVIYGIRMLEAIKEINEKTSEKEQYETHLIFSSNAEKTLTIETDYTIEQVRSLADCNYENGDMASAIASGSFLTMGMAVVPCSVKSLSAIANCYNDTLISRAADVILKERRILVIVPRETPLHKGHLELMVKVADYGGILLPPAPSFYHSPKNIADIVDQTVGKILDQFHIPHNLFIRWKGI